jgi:hypothetical protein
MFFGRLIKRAMLEILACKAIVRGRTGRRFKRLQPLTAYFKGVDRVIAGRFKPLYQVWGPPANYLRWQKSRMMLL